MKWANVFRRQTGLCVVFLHGWGASPPEVAPVDERLADVGDVVAADQMLMTFVVDSSDT